MDGLPYWLANPTVVSTSIIDADPSSSPISTEVLAALGIEELFAFQKWLISRLQCPDCGDLAISAPTGSGKTLAYVLPMLLSLKERRVKSVLRALIVVPVKDLIGQVEETVRVVEEALGIEDSLLTRGGVVVCTPGRLADLLQKPEQFKALEWLIVDEADRLLEHSTQSVWLPDLLQAISPGIEEEGGEAWRIRCRKLLFSATLTKNPAKLAPLQLTRPELLLVRGEASLEHGLVDDDEGGLMTPSSLREGILVIAGRDALTWKLGALVELLKSIEGKALIFCRSTDSTISLSRFLNRAFNAMRQASMKQELIAEAFHAHLNPQQRTSLLDLFKSSPSLRFLVSTDALARGIHLPCIDLVVNYDLPSFASTYVHRVGRTARAGRVGLAVSLVPGNAVQHLRRILEGSLKKKIRSMGRTGTLVQAIRQIERENFVGKMEVGERELSHLSSLIETSLRSLE